MDERKSGSIYVYNFKWYQYTLFFKPSAILFGQKFLNNSTLTKLLLTFIM